MDEREVEDGTRTDPLDPVFVSYRQSDGVELAVDLAGALRAAQAVVRVVAVDDDGQVHFSILPGAVSKNRHLLDQSVS